MAKRNCNQLYRRYKRCDNVTTAKKRVVCRRTARRIAKSWGCSLTRFYKKPPKWHLRFDD